MPDTTNQNPTQPSQNNPTSEIDDISARFSAMRQVVSQELQKSNSLPEQVGDSETAATAQSYLDNIQPALEEATRELNKAQRKQLFDTLHILLGFAFIFCGIFFSSISSSLGFTQFLNNNATITELSSSVIDIDVVSTIISLLTFGLIIISAFKIVYRAMRIIRTQQQIKIIQADRDQLNDSL